LARVRAAAAGAFALPFPCFFFGAAFAGGAARFAPLALAVRLALPALFLAAVFLPAVFLPPLSAGGLAAFFGAVVAGVWYGGGQGMVASFERTRRAYDQIASPPTASFRHDGIISRSDRALVTPAPRAGLSMQPLRSAGWHCRPNNTRPHETNATPRRLPAFG
jgi:hypothetical protein